MRWAITGTPGTGKTTVTEYLELNRPIVHLNQLVETGVYRSRRDEERDTDVADIEGLTEWLSDQPEDVIIESHLAHLLPVDRVIVLRCHPDELRERLRNRGGVSERKCDENVESERLDLILSEAVSAHGQTSVYEIDTTGTHPRDVAGSIVDAIEGTRKPSVGTVSFLEER